MVVQKGNVGSDNIYALPILHEGHNIYVFRGDRQKDVSFEKTKPILRLIGQDGNTAGGHTQTWEYANQSGDWFVGTKPTPDEEALKNANGYKDKVVYWDRQIARVHIPISSKVLNNTDLPRLSYLNRAGSPYISYSGSEMLRAEAAVSAKYKYFMVATIDKSGNGYFSLYSLDEVNNALNSNGTKDVNISTLNCIKAFKMPNFVSEIGSVQGYDIDENGKFIYVSSQYSPNHSDTTRKIVKIPWGETNSDNWEKVDLTNISNLDVPNYKTELEGIQLRKDNDLYLTVAYHDSTNLVTMNKIYEITWQSNF